MMFGNNKKRGEIFINRLTRGYSLVEVLVAITVLLIALVGPLTIAYSGLKRANFSEEQTAAIFLAQEGIEAIVKLREDGALAGDSFSDSSTVWGNIADIGSLCPIGSDDYCGVSIPDDGNILSSHVYRCGGEDCQVKYYDSARVPFKQGGGGGEDTIYSRRLQIDVETAYAHVVSRVDWGVDSSQGTELNSYIYNTYYEP